MNSLAKIFPVIALVAFCGTAQAGKHFNDSNMEIIPGPVVQVDAASVEVANVLLKIAKAQPAVMQEFVDAGNTIKAMSYQLDSPEVANYTVSTQQCMVGGIAGGHCIGGAELRATITRKQNGSMVEETVTAQVSHYRAMP